MMDQDSTTWTEARAPGVERYHRSHGGVHARNLSGTERRLAVASGGHEGWTQTMRRDTWTPRGQALPDRPALKPYRGKPAVRNFRGDDGDVGIIRSPVRAIALPDPLKTNRS